MDFVALDFETANGSRHSVCEIGLTIVENGIVIDSFSRLVRPRNNWFNDFNTRLHGIDAKIVSTEPEFDVVWEEVRPILDHKNLVAHNVSFDVGVLKSVLDLYQIEMPTIDYSCSCQMAKKTWSGRPSYSLNNVSDYLGISLERHHRAGDDALASAMIAIRAMEQNGVDEFHEISKKIGVKIGQIRPGDYVPIFSQSSKKKIKNIEIDPSKHEPDHEFYQKYFVFTGKMKTMTRDTGQKKVLDIGGYCQNQINRFTNFLVVGNDSYLKFKDGYRSEKMRCVDDFQNMGYDIEIMSEKKFLESLKIEKSGNLFND